MMMDLSVPKSNPIVPTVQQKDDKVKSKDTDVNEFDPGTY